MKANKVRQQPSKDKEEDSGLHTRKKRLTRPPGQGGVENHSTHRITEKNKAIETQEVKTISESNRALKSEKKNTRNKHRKTNYK